MRHADVVVNQARGFHLGNIYRFREAYRLSHLRLCLSATKDDASFCLNTQAYVRALHNSD